MNKSEPISDPEPLTRPDGHRSEGIKSVCFGGQGHRLWCWVRLQRWWAWRVLGPQGRPRPYRRIRRVGAGQWTHTCPSQRLRQDTERCAPPRERGLLKAPTVLSVGHPGLRLVTKLSWRPSALSCQAGQARLMDCVYTGWRLAVLQPRSASGPAGCEIRVASVRKGESQTVWPSSQD